MARRDAAEIPAKEAVCLGAFTPYGEAILAAEAQARQEEWDESGAQVTLFAGQPGALGDAAHDEELYTYKNSAVWSSGRLVRKRFTFPAPVLQAAWCNFECYGESSVLCFLHERSISIYCLSGQVQDTPFEIHQKFTAMWPLPQGVLLTGNTGQCAIATNPLEELQPVVVQERASYVPWDGDRVIWSSREVPYVVTFNEETKVLSIWEVFRQDPGSMPGSFMFASPGNGFKGSIGSGFLTPDVTPMFADCTGKRTPIRTKTGELSPAVFSDRPPSTHACMSRSMLLPSSERIVVLRAKLASSLNPDDYPDEACLASDMAGTPLIAVLSRNTQRLVVYFASSGPSGVHFAFRDEGVAGISAVQAFGIGNKRGMTHSSLVVLKVNGDVVLCKGQEPFCRIWIPPVLGDYMRDQENSRQEGTDWVDDMDMSPTPTKSGGGTFGGGTFGKGQGKVVGLYDGIGSRVTVQFEDGTQARCAIPFSPAYPLPYIPMEALQHALRQNLKVYWELHLKWLTHADTCRGKHENDWIAFCEVFCLQFLTPPSRPLSPGLGSPVVHRKNQVPKDEWYSGMFSGEAAPKTRRRMLCSPIEEEGNEALNQMLASKMHTKLLSSKRHHWIKESEEGSVPPHLGKEMLATVGQDSLVWNCLDALHSVYEDFKLRLTRWPLIKKLGEMLAVVALNVGAVQHLDHYARDIGPGALRKLGIKYPLPAKTFAADKSIPKDIHKVLLETLNGRDGDLWTPALVRDGARCVRWSAMLKKCYAVLGSCAERCSKLRLNGRMTQSEGIMAARRELHKASKEVVQLLVRWGWTLLDLQSVPFGVVLPIREALQRCKAHPPTGWPIEAYTLIGRDDIVATLNPSPTHIVMGDRSWIGRGVAYTPPGAGQGAMSPHEGLHAKPAPSGLANGRGTSMHPHWGRPRHMIGPPYTRRLLVPSLDDEAIAESLNDQSMEEGAPKKWSDGMEDVVAGIGRLRFSADMRLQEVRKLLGSSVPVMVSLSALNTHDGDNEMHNKMQARLMGLSVRTMALSVGRGAFTLGTVMPQPTEEMQIPDLCLAGRTTERGNIVNLDLSQHQPGQAAEISGWPEFHNGVAAGLKLAPKGAEASRSWLAHTRPMEPSHVKAGMFLAIGLAGHLDKITNPNVTRFLGLQHNPTIIAVLLGLGASRLGTMEENANTTMFLHLPHRHPQNLPELEMSSHVQAANLMALGLLYQGTAHRMMTALLLEEIGRRPGRSTTVDIGYGNSNGGVTQDREGYALAAGLALGLVNLGNGGQACGLEDLRIEECLRYYMVGGHDPRGTMRPRGSQQQAVMNTGLEGLLGPGGVPWDPDLRDAEMVEDLPGVNISLARDQASRGLDGDHTQVHGVSQVVLEGEMVNLDVTSPAATVALALMYLKTNDRNIASWFKIPQSSFELDYVCPDFILLRVLGRALVMWESIEPTEDWIRGQMPDFMRGPLCTYMNVDSMFGGGQKRMSLEVQVVAHAHINAWAGACLAIGLKFAGTANAQAEFLLRKYVLEFLAHKKKVPDASAPGQQTYGRLDKQSIELSIDVCALALSAVMAGTGHLPTLRLLRGLAKRLSVAPLQVAPNSGTVGGLHYGNHMAISMALGFLFLGGGSRSFRTDSLAVAMLLISLFPKFPQNPMDQRCHLQAFRHLYVLATEPRCMEAIDVETREAVYVPIKVTLNPKHFRSSKSPPSSSLHFGVQPSSPSTSNEAGPVDDPMAIEQDRPDVWDLSFERMMPCLVPERPMVSRIEILGPRYWQQAIEGPENLSHVYKTLKIFVKKKAGALSYAHDNSGVRSLLSWAVHNSLADPQTHGGFDLVHLCATFSADPSIMAFANRLCSPGPKAEKGTRPGALNTSSSGQLDATHEFQQFCRSALHECATHEKLDILPSYVFLYSAVQTLASVPGDGGDWSGQHDWRDGPDSGASGAQLGKLAAGPTVALWSLKLCLEYYKGALGNLFDDLEKDTQGGISESEEASSSSPTSWEPLLQPLFLKSLWTLLELQWERASFLSCGGTSGGDCVLKRYVCDGKWTCKDASRDAAGEDCGWQEHQFGVFLAMNDIPSAPEISATLAHARSQKDLPQSPSKAELLHFLRTRFQHISPQGAVVLAKCRV
ncbi:unnamed protein product [Ostreobium quekettii]|uniref:Anaphase-promoting complex subunit 1 n=1 Tax=Ostreobium quekettii TaxID=121088 RepID=A0A8S1INF2_9CHLO|nr:unnamed protein product [Ostreobium quekettii]